MHYTFISLLGENPVLNVPGSLLRTNVAKRGLDASRVCILEISKSLRLKIYKRSKKALLDILGSTSPREQVLMTVGTAEAMGIDFTDIGEGWHVASVEQSEGASAELAQLIASGSVQIVLSEALAEQLAAELSNIISKALFASVEAKVTETKEVYTLEWVVSVIPPINKGFNFS